MKLAKTGFGRASVNYLGHVIGHGVVRLKSVTAVLEYTVPTTRKSLMRFLGMAGYYRKFCPNFNQLKTLLSREPVLQTPDFLKPFYLHPDASAIASGAVFLQEKGGLLHPVAYYSAKFDRHQQQYSTIEKELIAIITAIKKFECYINPGGPVLHIYTDHNPLSFLEWNKFSNQHLLLWSLYLQPYYISIHHIRKRRRGRVIPHLPCHN